MIFGGCVLSERELAFIAIHKDSYPRVYSFVRRRVESAELAEELAADVFRVVWQKWDKETRTDIEWLLTVARNLIGKAGRWTAVRLQQRSGCTVPGPLSGSKCRAVLKR
jgi:RNA polymerase sigma-70 factor (ECF subfamily)